MLLSKPPRRRTTLAFGAGARGQERDSGYSIIPFIAHYKPYGER